MKNNYVIFWSDWDLYKQSFSDIMDKPYTRYITSPMTYMSSWKRFLYKQEHSRLRNIRRMARLMGNFKNDPAFWYPTFYKNDFENERELVFVFNHTWVHGELANYAVFLKQQYPQAHLVLVLFDLCQKNGGLDVSWAKSVFDLILSFDQNECEKYGFLYHPLIFSKYQGEMDDLPSYDVCFFGQPKDRLSEIIACLEKLWENDVTTDVHLIRVPLEEQVYKDRIVYESDMVLYKTNLQHFLHSNCALELMQHGGVGYTQRMCEAVALDKKIITNNSRIHEAPFYNPHYIFQIKDATDITTELCQHIKCVEPVDYHYKEKMSPIELLKFIENNLY